MFDGEFKQSAHLQAGTLQVMNASHALSQACEDRDFAEWHQGCPWCAVWVVLIESEALNATVHAARHALGDALLARYERQPHLTLAYRGLCDASQHAAAEFNPERLQDDLATLQALAQPPFSVQLQGVGSFSTVPYLGVTQGADILAQLHDALQPWSPVEGWYYQPHVTLGHYARELPLIWAVERLQTVGVGLPQLSIEVQQLALVRYASHDIAGPLALEGLWDLQLQQYQPQRGALWVLENGANDWVSGRQA